MLKQESYSPAGRGEAVLAMQPVLGTLAWVIATVGVAGIPQIHATTQLPSTPKPTFLAPFQTRLVYYADLVLLSVEAPFGRPVAGLYSLLPFHQAITASPPVAKVAILAGSVCWKWRAAQPSGLAASELAPEPLLLKVEAQVSFACDGSV